MKNKISLDLRPTSCDHNNKQSEGQSQSTFQAAFQTWLNNQSTLDFDLAYATWQWSKLAQRCGAESKAAAKLRCLFDRIQELRSRMQVAECKTSALNVGLRWERDIIAKAKAKSGANANP